MRTSNIISTRNFANPSHAIIEAGTIMQEATPNVGNLSSNWILLKWGLSLIRQIYGLIHKLSRLINLFSTTSCLSSSCVYRFWYTYFCFDPNYRKVVVASIQMLLAQPILDMAYFRHYYYYGHLLSIIKIYNPEEMLCSTSERDYKQQHWIEMLAFAQAEYHHAHIRPSSPSTLILRLLLE